MSAQNPIDALLKAEEDAEAEIERRHDAARETVNRAMETARAISERAHRRITNIHSHCAAAVKTQCDEMWRAYEAAPKTVIDDIATAPSLARVSERVAAKLTTAKAGTQHKGDDDA